MSSIFYSKSNSTNFLPQFPYDHLSDQRTQSWLLVDSFWYVAAFVGSYLLMCRHMPTWMQRRRKPFQLTALLIVYNLAMALLNAYICKELFVGAWRLKYNFWCQPCRVLYSTDEMKIASAVWWFYFSKLLEFSDTLFFILRKKSSQLSGLHVYHHSTMFPLWWIAVKWVPTGSTFFPALINSFVHVIMYSYYGLSTFGPAVQRFLWWKKYLTALQLFQFSVGLAWAAQAIANGCDFPTWINCATIVYMITFLILFGRFYMFKYQTRNKLEMMLSIIAMSENLIKCTLTSAKMKGANGNVTENENKVGKSNQPSTCANQ